MIIEVHNKSKVQLRYYVQPEVIKYLYFSIFSVSREMPLVTTFSLF